ncbi:molybdopterin cofactor-binding domain-containing protein [Emcibacter sp.]|uniref:xanthine dehydrogenase family protein molybdopterin-binding subunit n=1 Tax=Emcibacter sp. TaxID=1979954 RepID=UPI003A910B1B
MTTEFCPVLTRRHLLKAGAAAAFTVYFGLPENLAAAAQGKLAKSLQTTPALASWINIDEHNMAVVYTGKVELGQGIRTAIAQIVADELDLALAQITVWSAETDVSPDEGYTYGSMSIQQSGMAVRQAAAELRWLLVERAATKWAVPEGQIKTHDGYLSVGSRSISYGALIKETGNIEEKASGRVKPRKAVDRKVAGTSVNRTDIPAKVFAEESYIHDIRLPGMRHARMVRPPSYTARLGSMEGIVSSDLPGSAKIVRENNFVAVVAEREEQAIGAAEKLAETLHWQEVGQLPDMNGLEAFISDHPDTRTEVIRKPVSERKSFTHTARYYRPYQAHASLGPSIGLALWSENILTVWTHSQGIYPLRREISALLKLPEAAIKVIHRDGAGCYGHNGADDAALEAAWIAMKMPGVPVRLQWMRQEEFRWEPYGPAMIMEAAAELTTEGTISSWQYDVRGFPHSTRPNGGGENLLAARLLEPDRKFSAPRPIPQPAGGLDRNAVPYYDLPDQKITKNYIPNSPLRTSALRGLGAYGNIFAIESFMDELAHRVGADPVRFRLKHLTDPRGRAVITEAADMAGWQDAAKNFGGRSAGRGLAFARYKNLGGYLAVCVDLDYDPTNGTIKLRKINAAVDCGEVINPDGVRNQVEGGLLQSASWTLYEQVSFDRKQILSEDWVSYPIMTFDSVPEVHVHLIEAKDNPPLGAGEVAQGPMSAAIANALFWATGVRLRSLPFTAEKNLESIQSTV